MTFVIKNETTATHCVVMEQYGNLINVVACPKLSNGTYGYPTDTATYHYTDIKNAKRTFRRSVNKYKGV